MLKLRDVILLTVLLALSASSRSAGQNISARRSDLLADSSAFEDSLAAPFWSALAAIPCQPISWRPNVKSRSALYGSTEALRRRLLSDSRLASTVSAPVAERPIYSGPRYRIDEIQFAGRLPDVLSYGYLARPVGMPRRSPVVILLHGPGMHPQEAFGWELTNAYRKNERAGHAAFIRFAVELVDAGYTVFVPWLADDQASDYWPVLPWAELQRNGASLSARVKGLGTLHFLTNEVAGAADYVTTLPDVDTAKMAIIGWGEGAALGATAAALDDRFKAVVRLGAPLDRKALRATKLGILAQANFTHSDCELGELERASLIAPRPLLYAYSTKDESVAQFATFISPRIVSEIRSLYVALGRPQAFALQADTTWDPSDARKVRLWLDTNLGFLPRQTESLHTLFQPAAEQNYKSPLIDLVQSSRDRYVTSLGTCVTLSARIDSSSVLSFERSVEPLRREVANSLGLSTQRNATFQVIQRTLIAKRPRYSLEFVRIRSSRSMLPVVGLLALPTSASDHGSSAVVGLDGNFGLGRAFQFPSDEERPYLNGYADALANAGNVVFISYFPTAFPEIAASEFLARESGPKTSYALMIPMASAALDFVLSLPQVNAKQVALWGISYSGTLALYTAAFDLRASAVVYSNPVVTADVLFNSPDATSLATWWPEICSSLDDVQAYLIAPRRFVRENGLRDANGYEREPLESIKRIRSVYESLGTDTSFVFVRHSGGHETKPERVPLFGR